MPGGFSSKRHLLFDLDGTLVDSSAAHAWAFAEALRPKYPSLAGRFEYSRHLGRPTPDVFRSLGIHDASELEMLTMSKQTRYREAIARGAVDVFAGVHGLLKRAKASDRRLFIVTGASATSVRSVLSHTGLTGYFDGMVTAEDATVGKPSPIPYLHLLSQHHLAAADCVAIEDSEHGVSSATGAGIDAILVNTEVVLPGITNAGPIKDLAAVLFPC